jgi:amidase
VPEAEDPYRAWRWRTAIEGAGDGPLVGLRIAVKDAISVAGVPLTLGGRLLDGHVPTHDADVVRDVLRAGATIVGVGVCEDLCCSGSSFTSVTGPVTNPRAPGRSAGGSTSGCAVLVATGQADVGLGTDLGGSVRNPAAWCGIVGFKPTFGTLPRSGALTLEPSLDHIGLMARDVGTIIAVFDAMGGPDRTARCLRAATSDASPPATDDGTLDKPIRIGVVVQGFGWPTRSDPRVDAVVRGALARLCRDGWRAEAVSIPGHRGAPHIVAALSTDALCALHPGLCASPPRAELPAGGVARAVRSAVAEHPERAPVVARIAWIVGALLGDGRRKELIGRVARARAALVADHERALQRFDALVMPTVPMPAHRLPTGPLPADVLSDKVFEMHGNNCVANVTGLPAITVPCGDVDGLPVGLLMVGRRGDDRRLLEIARICESSLAAAEPC